MNNTKAIYQVLVEGSLNKEFKSLSAANRLADKYRNEGWNVKVIKMIDSIIGQVGYEV